MPFTGEGCKVYALTAGELEDQSGVMDMLQIDRPEPAIARLTLNQPARRNALTAAMWAALPGVLVELAADPALRVLVVTGAGEHFAAGADISEFETLYSTAEAAARISASIQAAFHALADFPLPSVAMIRGACIGGGAGLALCCDMRFADTTARFAITPAKLGLVYPFGDIARLIDAVGVAHARDILLSARIIKAKPARKMGLVHQVVGVDALETDVMDYARHMSALSPQSLRVTKSMINAYARGQRTDTPETDAQFLAGFSSDDFGEGFRAFMEKRKPEFG